MIVEITSLWANDLSIKQAFSSLTPEQSHNLMKVWCSISKSILSSGKFTKRSGKIQDVNRRVVIPDDTHIEPFVKAGMIVYTDTNNVSEMTPEYFAVFWAAYPKRETNGHEVKVGRKEAHRIFFNEILTAKDFEDLMKAVKNYETVTDKKYVCDAQRFLKNKWRDYVEISQAHKQTVKKILDKNKYNELYGNNPS